jgi:hypothetical protein
VVLSAHTGFLHTKIIHDITEILLKVALNAITTTLTLYLRVIIRVVILYLNERNGFPDAGYNVAESGVVS